MNAQKKILIIGCLFLSQWVMAKKEYLFKINSGSMYDSKVQILEEIEKRAGTQVSIVSEEGNLYKTQDVEWLAQSEEIEYFTPNDFIYLYSNPSIEKNRNEILRALQNQSMGMSASYPDNPAFKANPTVTLGLDPLLIRSWGLTNIGAEIAWKKTPQGKDIVVAVIDSGVDYTHPDLIGSLWKNTKEIDNDGIDNDNNGFIDDIVGWDFVDEDSKPYDLSMSLLAIILENANPGHGTHVTGVIASQLNNTKGTTGVAPQAKIMCLRAISEKGHGTSEQAIRAIDYATKNGAKIINASWGSERKNGGDPALKEAIERAEKAGVIFVAAAGNGRKSPKSGAQGFDNDTDNQPTFPSSYGIKNIVGVAALDKNEKLADFSNWGNKTVTIAAPGVEIMSTVPGNRYQDTVIDIGGVKATWDGTSMAAPFVAGSLAAIWSLSASDKYEAVVQKMIKLAKENSELKNKVSSGAQLDLKNIN